MSAKATVVDGPREPVKRPDLRRAMTPLLDLLGLDVDDVLGVNIGKGTIRVHLVTRAKRGRVYHYAVTRVSVPVVDDPEDA